MARHFVAKFVLFVLSGLLLAVHGVSLAKNFSLVLVGGGLADENEAIWGTVISLGGGKGVAKIGVIAAAGENPCCDEESSFYYYKTQLLQYGAAEVVYLNLTTHSKEENENSAVVTQINQCSGFFFTGGDQQRVIYSLYNSDEKVPSSALIAIKKRLLATGGVVAGTSAGTDCQTGSTMISGGESYESLVYGPTIFYRSLEYLVKPNLTAYGPGGIGLFPHGLIDTHFANRGRMGRSIALMTGSLNLPAGSTRAFGVDENTALVVTGPWDNRRGTVIGERGVLVMDGKDADGPVESNLVSSVKLHRMSSGDSIDLTTLAVTPAPYKTSMTSRESSDVVVKTSADVFGEGTFEFDAMALSLLQSKASVATGVSKESQPQIQVQLAKALTSLSGQRAEGFDGTDPTTGVYSFSYTNLILNIAKL